MNEVFELWLDGNLLEDFTTEADALAAVRQVARDFPPATLANVLLIAGLRDGDAAMREVAAGLALVALAERQHAGAAD